MGLFNKNDDATPLQKAVRELEEIDERLESGDPMDVGEREDMLSRRKELEAEVAELRGESPPAQDEAEPRPPDVEEEHLTKMR